MKEPMSSTCAECPLWRRDQLRGRHFSPAEYLAEAAGELVYPSKEPELPPTEEETAAIADEALCRAAHDAAHAIFCEAYQRLQAYYQSRDRKGDEAALERAHSAALADRERAEDELRKAVARVNALRHERTTRQMIEHQARQQAPAEAGPAEDRRTFLERLKAKGERSVLGAIRERIGA